MSYAVEWKPSARKEIRKLDPTVRRRVIEAVTALGAEPRPPGSVTLTGSPGWRRIRIGAYRVIYDVRDGAVVVLILRVGSRGSVYRRLDE
ncbi:MAG: type II toxin-antitoxin system RelE/ParE family toxin [Geodermatophilaceae bacterium]|nr:type II toxin-antitoxin system RelE/ParE family toxin [Geodermatophilaceae bacterium]MDQ3463706.1 type II toxin-antitoxin system RelE/ParE family toxin [Actinomycetota bacterium]